MDKLRSWAQRSRQQLAVIGEVLSRMVVVQDRYRAGEVGLLQFPVMVCAITEEQRSWSVQEAHPQSGLVGVVGKLLAWSIASSGPAVDHLAVSVLLDNHQVALLVTGRRPETGTTSNPFLLRDLRARRPVYLDHHQGTWLLLTRLIDQLVGSIGYPFSGLLGSALHRRRAHLEPEHRLQFRRRTGIRLIGAQHADQVRHQR